MQINFILIFALITFPSICYSERPQSVVGFWKYHHATGSPCKELIVDLDYHFASNGDYKVETKMRSMGKLSELSARGTYEATATTITTRVDDITIGPLRYRFEKEYLIFEQHNPRCDIYLVLEDY